MGSGTTLVEAKLLGRNASATELHFIKDNHIDFICTHPPYANIIKYSKGIEGDVSLLGVDEFLAEMKKVAKESFRVLKKGKICAIMIGDIRKHGKVIPLGFRTMECFLQEGFVNKEIIIKEQHNCHSMAYWEKRSNSFFLLAHEYIFVFQRD